MSSTNRGATRQPSDYYVTPPRFIEAFLSRWAEDEPRSHQIRTILDPCAGGTMGPDGLPLVEMSYPRALSTCSRLFHRWNAITQTMDIRQDSLADHKGADYLTAEIPNRPDLIISNPPFTLAREFIDKALSDVAPGGFVVMLLRLNFFGGQERAGWLAENMPQRAYVHARRMGFNEHRSDLPAKQRRATDSIEYMHAVWNKDSAALGTSTILKVI